MVLSQAGTRANEAAVRTSRRTLSFAEIASESAAIGEALLAQGVSPGDRVGISLPKGWQQIISVLGILQIGGVYVPLDPSLPKGRVAAIRTAAGIRHLCVMADTDNAVQVIEDDFWADTGDQREDEPKKDALIASDIAYILFTSGTTGDPKGVAVQHGAAVASALSLARRAGIAATDAAIGLSSLGFDPSIFDMFSVLGSGATLVLPDEDTAQDPAHWEEIIRRYGVTHWCSVPLLFDMYVSHLAEQRAQVDHTAPESLRVVMLGGERTRPGLVSEAWRIMPDVRMAVVYGPTESCIASTWEDVGPAADFDPSVVGQALSGENIVILSTTGRLLSPGEQGEVAIGGSGLALGYWGDDELTAQSFVELDGLGRYYRSGDRGELTDDGKLRLLGRIDRQVKLSGVRIELDEIEIALRSHPGIEDVAVTAPTGRDGVRSSAAWVVASDPQLDSHEVRQWAARALTNVAVPRSITFVSSLPRTANGKVDHQALERAAQELSDLNPPRARPASTIHRVIAAVDAAIGGHADPASDFFEIGGNSLAAVRLVARLRTHYGTEVPTSLPFDHPVVRDMANELVRRGFIDEDGAADAFSPGAETQGPASRGQSAIWFLDRKADGNLAYHAQSAVRFVGALDEASLTSALQSLVERHEIYRTTFHEMDGEVLATTHPSLEIKVEHHDRRSIRDEEEAVDNIASMRSREPFDLTSLPLVRWDLVRTSDDRHVLVQTEHHMVHDGWSTAVAWRDVERAYRAARSGAWPSLPGGYQHQDFVAWQRRRMGSDRLDEGVQYWRERLDGLLPTELVVSRSRPRHQTFEGSSFRTRLPQELYIALRDFAAVQRVSLYTVVASAFAVFLKRYGATRDVSFGTWAANREREEFDEVIGMLVNMVVVRIDVAPETTASELVRRMAVTLSEALDHQWVPFDEVVRAVGQRRDASRNPLISTTLSFHDAPMPEFDWPDVVGTFEERHNGSAKFDLNVIGIPRAEQRGRPNGPLRDDEHFEFIWEFNADLFDRDLVRDLARSFELTLRGLADSPDAVIEALTGAEEQSVIVGPSWNAPPEDVVSAFERVASERPDALAVRDGSIAWSYAELVEAVDNLATALVNRGVTTGSRVAIVLDRSVWLPTAMLATLSVGAAYVPIDPDVPDERLESILWESEAMTVIADRATTGRIRNASAIVVEDLQTTAMRVRADSTWEDAPAYVIFTSGSTGQPKGVEISRSALSNLLASVATVVGMDRGATLLAATTASFDIAALELLGPLYRGGTVVVADAKSIVRGDRLAALLKRDAITVMQATPMTWRLLLAAGWSPSPGLTLLSGGEGLPRDLAAELLANGHGILWNLYGPTETTIWSTLARVTTVEANDGTRPIITIGRPLHSTTVLVVNESMLPVPVGAPGQIVIAGAGLGAYVRSDSVARFVSMEVDGIETPVFLTGDLGVLDRGGCLHYLRRMDRQVKLRGYRIEPAEIESVIRAQGNVYDCAVVVNNGLDALVAHVVGELDDAMLSELRMRVAASLPRYMIPAAFLAISELPRTVAGKLDVAALASITVEGRQDAQNVQTAASDEASDVEQSLALVWTEILGKPGIQRDDDFFGVGGHSLLALRLVARVRSNLGFDLTLDTVFDYPTLRGMAAAIEGLNNKC